MDLSKKSDFGFTGYFTNNETVYHLTRYPRKKYGSTAPIETYRCKLQELENKFGVVIEEENILKLPRFRAILGLRVGYEKGQNDFTIDKVKKELGRNFIVNQAEICTVRKGNCYTEDAVIIESDLINIFQVYLLAEKLLPERLSVEDFSDNIVYMVEAKHCKEPDK